MFWDSLTPTQQQTLMAAGDHRAYRSGEFLFHQGDRPTSVLIVRSGRVKLVRSAATGREVLIELRMPNQLLGEMGVIDSEVRSVTARAMGPVEILNIPAARFTEVLRRDSAICIAVLASVTQRLRETVNRRIESGTTSVVVQLCGRLSELAANQSPDADGSLTVDDPLTQQELADWIGASRDAVVIAFQRLREEDLVETGRRRIRILDPDRLADYARSQQG